MKSSTVKVILIYLEFYAVNSSVNVAFRKPSWLSSAWIPSFKASNVVDGTKYLNLDTFFQRCVHTRHEPFPRWWVNLTGDYTILRIDIDYRGGCPTGWYGQNNCDHPCPEGCLEKVCNPDNGTCLYGCKTGLQGITCNTTCDDGRFGLGCQQYCYCLGETCDPQNGLCPDSRCQWGWNGSACNQTCGRRTFGDNCVETCHCRQGSCHPANGTCLYEGCLPGWQTESCSEECDEGRFGHECSVTCGACRDNVPCDHVTGICPNGCADGWTKPSCNETCPTGTFGFNCTRKCFCKNGTCDPASGSCPDSDCDKGWRGPTCSLQCEAGFFGYNCKEACHCRIGSCNRTTGLCSPGGCKDGWQMDTCSEKCDKGFYGTNCSVTCGNCTDNGSCHHINGHCTQGCDPGFHGEQCHKACDDGTFGLGCQQYCYCLGETCDPQTGMCPDSRCQLGWKGTTCNQRDQSKFNDNSASCNLTIIAILAAVCGLLFVALITIVICWLRNKQKRKNLPERSVPESGYASLSPRQEEPPNVYETLAM